MLDDYHKIKKRHHLALYEYLLIAKRKNTVYCFMFFEYSLEKKFLYIDYLGARDNERNASYQSNTRIGQKCYKLLQKEIRNVN